MQPIADRLVAGSVSRLSQRQRGFSLFELIVYILAASILFSVMLNRYRDFPAEAERANFLAVVGQLRAAVNLQMMTGIAEGRLQGLEALEGSNPMDLLLEMPVNYRGEFDHIDVTLPRRSWYFDRAQGELVYHVGAPERVSVETENGNSQADQIRFQMQNVYGESGWQGLVLAPVYPYEWLHTPIERALTSN